MAKRKITANGNVEQLALKAKLKRQTDCSEAVNNVLAVHNCQLEVMVQVGDSAKRLNEVLGLPTIVMVMAKEVAPCQV